MDFLLPGSFKKKTDRLERQSAAEKRVLRGVGAWRVGAVFPLQPSELCFRRFNAVLRPIITQ